MSETAVALGELGAGAAAAPSSPNAARRRTVAEDIAAAQSVINAARAETVAEQQLQALCENPRRLPRYELRAAARRLQLLRLARQRAVEELDR